MYSIDCQNQVLVVASLRLYHKLYVEPFVVLVVDSVAMVHFHLILSTYRFDHLCYTLDHLNHLNYFVVSNSNDSDLRISLTQNGLHPFQHPRTMTKQSLLKLKLIDFFFIFKVFFLFLTNLFGMLSKVHAENSNFEINNNGLNNKKIFFLT